MILSDGLIKELISYRALVIEPLSETQIQPSSVDLTLGSTFLAIDNINVPFLDPKRKETIKYREIHIEKGGQLILQPGFFFARNNYRAPHVTQLSRSSGRRKILLGTYGHSYTCHCWLC